MKTRADSLSGTSQTESELRIGCRDPGAHLNDGIVDDVRFYDRELTAAEVAYLAGAEPSSPAIANIPRNAKSFRGSRYALIDTRMSWADAKKACQETGGQLVCIESEEEQQFVMKQFDISGNTWLGASDEASEGDCTADSTADTQPPPPRILSELLG